MGVVLDEAMLAQLQATQVDINIHITAKVNVTPFIACQKVNGLLLDKAGTGLLSESPELTTSGGRLCWRVPVALALPGRGRLGQVGSVDVDVQTGEALADNALIDDIARHASQLAASSSS
jgi:hypothetical protein